MNPGASGADSARHIHYNACSPASYQWRAYTLRPIIPVETLANPATDSIWGTWSSKPETGGIWTNHELSYP